MAESELSITYAELLAEVAQFLGYGQVSTLTAAQLERCDSFVQAGVRRFYYPPAVQGAQPGYKWSFLAPVVTLATIADQEAQDLPGDLGRVVGQFHYAADLHKAGIVQVPEDRFQAAKTGLTSGPPAFARVRHKAKQAGTGQRLEVAWWPTPDAVYTLTYAYEAFAGKLAADNPYPLGGMRYAEVIVPSCLAVAEMRGNDERGMHALEFERLLIAAIEQDRRNGTLVFGPMGDRKSEAGVILPRRGDTGSTHTVTYNGVPL